MGLPLRVQQPDRSAIESYASKTLQEHYEELQAELIRIRSEENERISHTTVIHAVARLESVIAAAYDLLRISMPVKIEIAQVSFDYAGNHVASPHSSWPMYNAHACIDVDPYEGLSTSPGLLPESGCKPGRAA